MCIYCGTINYRKIYENHNGPILRESNGRSYEIHHIDGNHYNNEPSNLKLVTLQEHYDIHYAQGDWFACGKIGSKLNLSSYDLSLLAEKNNQNRIDDGTHHFLKKGKDSVRFNPSVYTFVHTDGRIEKCTYYEMRNKHNLGPSNLTNLISGKKTKQGNRVRSVKGWYIV